LDEKSALQASSDSDKQVLSPELRASAHVVPVVVMGASAGGLEVFKLLLQDLPGDIGFAIVFIQHLDPNHHSLLAEILSRASTMPVSEAANGMLLEANHVYVMPANVDMTLEGGALRLAPRTQTPGSHMPIDRFLRSAADQCGRRAIEASARKLAAMILRASGYVVLEASNGRHGLEVCAAHQGSIGLLLTDVMNWPNAPSHAGPTWASCSCLAIPRTSC
jgi:hypothetical protein